MTSFSPSIVLPGDVSTADLDLDRVVRSAAYLTGCPVAAFFVQGAAGFTNDASFGFDAVDRADVGDRILFEALHPRSGGLLIVNDLLVEPGFTAADSALFGAGIGPVRFVAAASVAPGVGTPPGILVVADIVRHAGLSPAQTYVLRTQAAQIAALIELSGLRDARDGTQVAALRDIDTQRLRLLESVVVHANDAVLITEAEPVELPGPRIVYCNAAFTRTTGYDEADVLGRTPRILQDPSTDRAALDRLRLALSRWEPIEIELFNRRKNGEGFWVELSIVPVADERGWFTHWVSVQRDVSERKRAEDVARRIRIAEADNLALEQDILERKRVEAQLSFAAFHDDLTKLHNRAYFMTQLGNALARVASSPDVRCALLFLDLDRFKLVNDSLGHRIGDLLLMEVANRLRGCVRAHDTLARIGGDEFALLIEDVGASSDAITPASVIIAERIVEAMRQPVWLGKQEIFASCSIGVVSETTCYGQSEELMRDADAAMYQAKRQEPGSYAVFSSSMRADAAAALALRTDLQNALIRNEFTLRYQPICDAVDGAVLGVEALIRWQHPQRGLVPPGDFITAAEETGLIRAIGRWVLTEACSQMRRWQARFPMPDLRLSVNSSGIELRDPRFTAGVRAVLEATGFDPRLLQLEVTESVFLQQPERIDEMLGEIRSLGVRIALDDFGTGYSSLSYLDRYPVNTIKIDRSFIARMLTRPGTMVMVNSIVKLGLALDMDIVAEGVETDLQLQALRATGCCIVQGYLLGRPMAADEIDIVLARQFGIAPERAD